MYDLLLRGALVVDGTGGPPETRDVLVHEGRISGQGRFPRGSARRILDLDGCVLAPGFIDLHTHCDFTIHDRPDAPAMVRQGVTTIVLGNCGYSSFPVMLEDRAQVAEWAAFIGGDVSLMRPSAHDALLALEALPLALNVAQLVGHGTVRLAVMGDAAREATDAESSRMAELVRLSVRNGAVGLSTGLIYPPGSFATPGELMTLAREVGTLGGWYASHIRNEADGLLEAIEEAIQVGAQSGVGVHISHLKASGSSGRGLISEAMHRIDAARSMGMDLTADQYPYTSSSTKLRAALPLWAREAVADPAGSWMDEDGPTFARLREEMDDPSSNEIHRRPDRILIVDPPGQDVIVLSLAEYATRSGLHPASALLRLCANGGDSIQMVVLGRANENDIKAVLRHESIAIASDGWTLAPGVGRNPHPRSFGTFVRVLGRYARDEHVLSLATAIRKMTVVPAGRLGFRDLGALRAGAMADLVVFDPSVVDETATFEQPFGFARGVPHVLVRGEFVVDGGHPTDRRPGRVLRLPSVAA